LAKYSPSFQKKSPLTEKTWKFTWTKVFTTFLYIKKMPKKLDQLNGGAAMKTGTVGEDQDQDRSISY
jgi:hypothetical protein